MHLRLLLGIVFFISTGALADKASHIDSNNPWGTPYVAKFDPNTLPNRLPTVSVRGNEFVDENGKVLVFRGVNIGDPDKLLREGRWDKSLFKELKKWGTNIVRIPVHPLAWRVQGKTRYLELLDEAVIWANTYEMHVIIDWHSIGNLKDAVYQHPMYDTTKSETLSFWKTMAERYSNTNTIAFYELFNEPTQGEGRFGTFTWPEWKALNIEMINIIRAHADETVVLVGGFNWAYDLSSAKGDLIDLPQVAYVAHPYPQKAKKEPLEKDWYKRWGFITEHAPLIATEIGWMHDGEPGAHVPTINNDDTYGPRITKYLDERGASWVAWVFDPDWTPNMIKNWDYEPTTQGEYFRKEMLRKNSKR